MPEIRAFLAIDLDDDLKPKINSIIKEFRGSDANIKYVDLANLHLTLKFFGDIDVEGIDLLGQKISDVVAQFDSFSIKIRGCGAFPNSNHIKVIWVGIEDDDVLRDLHDRLDAEFKKLGFEADRKFSSHLTIGRMKSARNKDKVKSAIESFGDVEVGEMKVEKIILKKSTLKASGPIYEDIKIFEL